MYVQGAAGSFSQSQSRFGTDMRIKWRSAKCPSSGPCGLVAEKDKNPEASLQWSKTVVTTTKAVLFLPAANLNPSITRTNRFAAALGLKGCPLTAIVPRAKQNHKL